jgi:serine/threonine-protein phosphatase 6 regulatory ankyrin repeat subunit B
MIASNVWAGGINSDLIKAAYLGNTSKVEALLKKGADINAKSHSKWTVLMYAASRDNIDTVRLLLGKGADIEAKDRQGYTALMLAALSGHTRVVKALLNKGADAGVKAKNGYTASKLAKEGRHKTTFALLKKAEAGNFYSDTPAAIVKEYKGKNDIDNILLRQSSKKNRKTRSVRKNIRRGDKKIKTTAITGNKSIYNGWFYLGKYDRGRWANKTIRGYLHRVPETGEKITLQIPMHLMDDRPDPSAHKNSRLVPPYNIPMGVPLAVKKIDSKVGLNNVWVKVQFSAADITRLADKTRKAKLDFLVAVKNGNAKKLSALLDKNPDIDARYKDGMTPLILAAKKGYTEIVQIILDKGADVNEEADDGWTALMTAAWKGRTATARTLLDKGADVNKKSYNGWTALLAASKYGYLDIVEMLMNNGASVTEKNRHGKTALMLASARGHTEIAKLIKQRGITK